jgi:hypothetical protein
MNEYRIVQVDDSFVVFAGDVSILRCHTERDAEAVVASALDLLENPSEWWRVLRERLAANIATRTDAGSQAARPDGGSAGFVA